MNFNKFEVITYFVRVLVRFCINNANTQDFTDFVAHMYKKFYKICDELLDSVGVL